MKTKIMFRIAVVFLLTVSIFSCKKKDSEETVVTPPLVIPADTPLTAAQSAFLESATDTFIRLEDIILEDGQDVRSFLEAEDSVFLQTHPSRIGSTNTQSAIYQKKLFISRMFAMGNSLVKRSNHTHGAGAANEPAQTGLGYSWGSKDYNVRQFPPTVVNPGCNSLKIYGLDCTGMIWAMTQAAKLTNIAPKYNFFVEYIADENKWTDAFKSSADYPSLRMKNMGQLSESEMKNGDVIFWNSHIGTFLNGKFYQSNGNPAGPDCNNNLSSGRGPRMITLSNVLSWGGMGGYKVFRITNGYDVTVTLAGTNIFAIYCYFDYADTASFSFELNPYDTLINAGNVFTFTNHVGHVLSVSDNPPCSGVSTYDGNLLNLWQVDWALQGSDVHLLINSDFIQPAFTIDCGAGTFPFPTATQSRLYNMPNFPNDNNPHTVTLAYAPGEVITVKVTPK